jgi:thioredoxin
MIASSFLFICLCLCLSFSSALCAGLGTKFVGAAARNQKMRVPVIGKTCSSSSRMNSMDRIIDSSDSNSVSGASASAISSLHESISSIRGGGSNAVIEIKDLQHFNTVVNSLSSDRLVVVDFTASWCGPCRMIAPIYQQLAQEFGGKVTFLKVDVDAAPAVAQKFSVMSMPTFVFLKNKGSNVVSRFSGADTAKLTATVREHM